MRRPILPFVLLLGACGPVGLIAVGLSGADGGSGLPVAPTAPSGLIATPVSPTRIGLAWIDNAATETGFAIEQRRVGEATFAPTTQVGRDTTTFSVGGLTPQTAYEFRVLALNSGGQRPSNTAVATTPAELVLVDITPDSAEADTTDPVRLRGRGFLALLPGQQHTVRFGAAAAPQVTVIDDETMSVVPPPGVSGATSVTIENGYESRTTPDAFTYFSPPVAFAPNDQRVNVTPVGLAGSGDPEMACSGRFVYCVWIDRRSGPNTDIFCNRSTDGGASWSTNEARLDTDPAGSNNSGDMEVCAEGSNVYVVWQDSRNGSLDIYFNRSVDHGATWLANDVRIDTDAAGSADSLDPEICAVDGKVYVTWQDLRNGRPDVYFTRSFDAGSSWLAADVRLNDDQSPGSGSTDPDIRCAGDAVYVAWRDSRNGLPDVYFDRSLDGGVTWLPADRRLDTDPAGSGDSGNVEFCVVDARVVAVWQDLRNGQADVYANRSVDGGMTWAPDDWRLDTDTPGATTSLSPEICGDGAGVHVVWADARDGGSIRSNSSADGGLTWLQEDRRIDTATVPVVTFGAVVGCQGRHVHAAWTDSRAGFFDVRYNDSIDGGVTWRSQDLRLDTNQAGAANSGQPQLCVDGARVTTCWLDDRDGSNTVGVYSNRRVP